MPTLTVDATATGTLDTGDSVLRPTCFFVRYDLAIPAGKRIEILYTSADLLGFLYLLDDAETEVAEGSFDLAGGANDVRLTKLGLAAGDYILEVAAANTVETGDFDIVFNLYDDVDETGTVTSVRQDTKGAVALADNPSILDRTLPSLLVRVEATAGEVIGVHAGFSDWVTQDTPVIWNENALEIASQDAEDLGDADAFYLSQGDNFASVAWVINNSGSFLVEIPGPDATGTDFVLQVWRGDGAAQTPGASISTVSGALPDPERTWVRMVLADPADANPAVGIVWEYLDTGGEQFDFTQAGADSWFWTTRNLLPALSYHLDQHQFDNVPNDSATTPATNADQPGADVPGLEQLFSVHAEDEAICIDWISNQVNVDNNLFCATDRQTRIFAQRGAGVPGIEIQLDGVTTVPDIFDKFRGVAVFNTGLTNGVGVVVRARFTYDADIHDGAASDWIDVGAIAPDATPGAPEDPPPPMVQLGASGGGDGTATVRWFDTAVNEGAGADSYDLYQDGVLIATKANGAYTGTFLSIPTYVVSVPGLTLGQTYEFALAQTTGAGTSDGLGPPATVTVFYDALVTRPPAPENFDVTTSDDWSSADIVWTDFSSLTVPPPWYTHIVVNGRLVGRVDASEHGYTVEGLDPTARNVISVAHYYPNRQNVGYWAVFVQDAAPEPPSATTSFSNVQCITVTCPTTGGGGGGVGPPPPTEPVGTLVLVAGPICGCSCGACCGCWATAPPIWRRPWCCR